MDDLILSEKVLNQQVCIKCLNYLSVGPIMVSHQGTIICGRCSPNKQSESKVWNHSLYNLIAEKLVFKCINQYEGCEELLDFNEAVEHERNCKKEGFKCPFCDYNGNGCQLIHHCDQKHPHETVKEDTFKIIFKETISKQLIFVKNNNIFCLNLSINDTFIEFSNLQMSPAHVGPKHFKLRFFKSNTNIEFVTPIQSIHKLGNFPSTSLAVKDVGKDTNSNQMKNSSILDHLSLLECFPSGWCLCKIELIENYNYIEQVLKIYLQKIKKKIDTKLPTDIVETKVEEKVNKGDFDIKRVLKMSIPNLREFVKNELQLMKFCVSCKKYIITDVYFCPKYHMACKNCSGMCGTCGIFCQWSLRPKLNILLRCEWNGCNGRPNIFNYLIHKRDCNMRQYKCPDVECEFEGSLIELKKHWHMNPIFDTNNINGTCTNQGIFWHVSKYHEIFYVGVEQRGDILSVTINEVDVVLHLSYNFLIKAYSRKHDEESHEYEVNIYPKEGKYVAKLNDPQVLHWRNYYLYCSLT